MPEARYFLAHTRLTPDADIDAWTKALTIQLGQPGWSVKVIPGRDDFKTRAKALGGWKGWCRDVPNGCNYDGDALFHGVIVPVLSTDEAIGRATATLLQGFLQEGKHVVGWSPSSGDLVKIVDVVELPPVQRRDNWQTWARLEFAAA